MRRLIALLLALLIPLLTLTGCSSLLEREYVVTSRHAEMTTVDSEVGSVRLTDLDALITLLADTVRQGTTKLTAQLVYRNDNLERELQAAVSELRTTDPICAYAVEFISAQQTKILTYYEIRFDISYRRTPDQIAALRSVDSPLAFRQELTSMLSLFTESRAFLISGYSPEKYDFDTLFTELYYNMPAAAYGMVSASAAVTPETGDTRVMEITVTYNDTPSALMMKSMSATSIARVISSNAQEEGDALAVELHDALCRFARYDEETAALDISGEVVYTDPYTVYGALTQTRAVSTGYAMAYRQLCDEAGIECMIVRGRLGSENHAWNLVRLSDGNWYHVDVSLDDDETRTGYRFFGLGDDDMSLTHQWDTSVYPACTGTSGRGALPDDEELRGHSRHVDIVPSRIPGEISPYTDVDVEIIDLPPSPTDPTSPTSPTEPSQPSDPSKPSDPTDPTAETSVSGTAPSTSAEPSPEPSGTSSAAVS